MKLMLFPIVILISLQSCKDNEANPTIFKGQVEFADNGEIVTNGWLIINGNKYGNPIDSSLGNDTAFVEDTGKFNIKIESNEDVDYYIILFEYFNRDKVSIILASEQMDCLPYNCGDIRPGKEYLLKIKIPR